MPNVAEVAALPSPLLDVAEAEYVPGVPANTLSVRAEVILRTIKEALSMMYKLPALSPHTLRGELKFAEVAEVPLVLHAPAPYVITNPEGRIFFT